MELELLDTTRVNSYYRVYRAESEDTGWVWSRNVRVVDIATPLAMLLAGPHRQRDRSRLDEAGPVVGMFRSPC